MISPKTKVLIPIAVMVPLASALVFAGQQYERYRVEQQRTTQRIEMMSAQLQTQQEQVGSLQENFLELAEQMRNHKCQCPRRR